jgi:hypothetical protein
MGEATIRLKEEHLRPLFGLVWSGPRWHGLWVMHSDCIRTNWEIE